MYMLKTFHPMFHCICMYNCMLMSGLRLSDLNKETTYLLTYLLTYISPNFALNLTVGRKCEIWSQFSASSKQSGMLLWAACNCAYWQTRLCNISKDYTHHCNACL